MMHFLRSQPYYWAHSLVIYIWTILATIVLGSTTILSSFFSKTGNGPHKVAQLWGRSILFFSGVRVRVLGTENLEPGRSYIYMANHQSNFDIPVLLGRLPAQFRWLAKAELFKIPIFGRGMQGCGYISIDRSNRKSAFQSLAKAARTIREGTSVLIFPEGTRTGDGHIKDFKKGGFVLAVDAGVPIVPIIIRGTYAIMPRTRFQIRPRPVVMEIHRPIETAQYTRKTKDELMQHVRNAMIGYFESGKEGHPPC
jgi:1-acyl-sn-glycerol-3-phosphate acyltransferase